MSRVDPAPEVTLENGTKVAASYKRVGPDLVFAVDENLEPGTKFFIRGASGTAVPSFELTVGPPAEPPSRLGTLEVDRPSTGDPLSRSSATVSLRLAPEAEGTWAATELALEVDGGEVLSDRSVSISRVHLPATLSALCGGDSDDPGAYLGGCGAAARLRRLTPGKHTVTVRAHVAGASPDPAPASAEVEFRCLESTGAKPDAGTVAPRPTADAGTATLGPSPDDGEDAVSPKPATRSGGCTFAGDPRCTSPLLLALSFVIGALLRRRAKRCR